MTLYENWKIEGHISLRGKVYYWRSLLGIFLNYVECRVILWLLCCTIAGPGWQTRTIFLYVNLHFTKEKIPERIKKKLRIPETSFLKVSLMILFRPPVIRLHECNLILTQFWSLCNLIGVLLELKVLNKGKNILLNSARVVSQFAEFAQFA